jgi:PAS domain S-box-containing protein
MRTGMRTPPGRDVREARVTVKARLGTRWHSIERQLPLLIAGLLLVTVFAFAWGAYQRVKHVLLAAAGQRLQSTSVTLDLLFAEAARHYARQVDSATSDPAVVTLLTTGQAAPDLRRHLAAAWAGDPAPRARIELLRPDGTVALDTSRGAPSPHSAWASQIILAGGPLAATPHVSPFRGSGDSTYSEAIVPIRAATDSAHAARIIGYAVDLRFTSNQSGDAVRDLIGPHATILVGSPGENAWTDLNNRRQSPPSLPTPGQSSIVIGASGKEAVAVETAVPGAPWMLWVEQPTDTVLAPMRALLIELGEVAGIIVLAGALAGWLLSRRITGPIVSLTSVAERIVASGEPATLPSDADEVTRLGDAIRRMAVRVRDSLTTTEAARAEAETLAGELRDRTVALEQQTREAHALAAELEQQFEEAQSLSEELEQSNERLLESATDADAARRTLGDIVESITDAFVAYDRNWCITFINRRAQQYFRQLGVTATEFQGQNVWTFFPQSRGTVVETEMRRTMEDRVTVAFETEVGGDHWLAIRAYPSADGGVTAVWTDVTEAKRAAIANAFLAEASRLLSASLDAHASMRDVARAAVPALSDWCGVDLVTDPRSTEWPPAVTRLGIAHQNPEQVAFATAYQERNPIDWSATSGIATVLRTGEPQLVPAVTDDMITAIAKSEEHLADLRRFGFASVMIVPITARGRTLGVLSLAMAESGRRFDTRALELVRNLADRAAIALDNAWLFREADGARANAEAANKAKLDFLASMSHELRTPLNAIAGYVQLLDMQVAGPVVEEQRRFLARIRRAQDLLLGRINDMLNFVKIDSGTLTYTLRPVRLPDILAGLDIMIQPQLTERGLSYQYVPADPALVVRVDSEKLEQILLNLLSNATKFTPRGGRITLAAARRGARVEVTVSDTGVGIPPDRLAAIFEPFVQLDPSLTRERDGTGLGLAISRDLARAMGGEVTVSSAPGSGSTFTLLLPAHTQPGEHSRETESAVRLTPAAQQP